MALIDVLKQHFKKGAAVFDSSDELTTVKKKLFGYLRDALPWTDQSVNSGFGVFAQVDWPHASNTNSTIVHAVRTLEGAQPVGEKLWARFDDRGGGELPSIIRRFAQLMLAESNVEKFINASQGTKYELGIDYYPNRAPNASAGYHKDAYANTTFILLAYLNESPIWGAEWILDPGDPTTRYPGGVGQAGPRSFESVLPSEIQTAIRSYRTGVASQTIGSKDASKDHAEWKQYARSKIIEKFGNVVFFDPIVTHSSPFKEDVRPPARFSRNIADFWTVRQDQPGFPTDQPLRLDQPAKFHSKARREIKQWKEHEARTQPFRHLDLAIDSRLETKLRRGEEWLKAKAETFEASRKFIRIEVRAYPA